MEVIVDLKELVGGLKKISAVAKATDSELSGQVYFETNSDNVLSLLATNNRITITEGIFYKKASERGRFCVSFIKLFSFLNSFKYWDGQAGVEEVKLKLTKTKLSVHIVQVVDEKTVLKNKISLRLFPVEKVLIPSRLEKPNFILNSEQIKEAITKTIFAVGHMSHRAFLQTLLFKLTKERVFVVGTDALKLSEYSFPNTGGLDEGEFLVPYSYIMCLRKLLTKDTQVFFEVSEGKIKVGFDNVTLHGNLLIGESFPDYAATFSAYKHEIKLNRNLLLSAIRPYLPLLEDDYRRITLHINKNELHIYSLNTSSKYSADIDFDEEFVIDVNGVYLTQVLETFTDDFIKLRFTDERGVLIITQVDKEDQRALLTPITRRG